MISVRKVQNRADLLVKTLWPRAHYQVSVDVVGRAKMRNFNRKFRKKDAPTDVLSFPAPEVFTQKGILGDLLICLPVARVQAKAQGHSLAMELDVLLIHGILHLLGYDHEVSPKEEKRMRAAEKRCFKKILKVPPRGGGLIARNSLKTRPPSR